jgi:hypothetical protein
MALRQTNRHQIIKGIPMATSFAVHIAPLFTDIDVNCMDGMVQLREYSFMSDLAGDGEFPDHAIARLVLKRLTLPDGPKRMPRGRPPWSAERIALFATWIDEGFLP